MSIALSASPRKRPSAFSDGTDVRRHLWLARLAVGSLFLLSGAVVLAGQCSTDLVTMDDFREAEIAREMLERGDFVVPHLAGLSFVEKPPGYPVLLSAAYVLAGGPSVPAARLLTAIVALLSLAAVYELGKTMDSPVAGAAGALALATSVCFSRAAHTILLDNALVASLAWAHVLAAGALRDESPQGKRWRYAGSFFLVGVSFLFKGFVGPAIFGAGALAFVVATRSWREAATALHPLSLAGLLVPVLSWVVPFVRVAPPSDLYAFFVLNHFGRALHAYESHGRPLYYYALTLWWRFAPASLLLPFAVGSIWKRRRHPDSRGEVYLLWSAVGGLLLLSMSRAKDDPYLLPVYPLLACMVGCAVSRFLAQAPAGVRRWSLLAAGAAGLASVAVALILGILVGGWRLPALLVLPLSLGGAAGLAVAHRQGRAGASAWIAGSLAASCALLIYSDPIWPWYEAQRTSRPALRSIAAAAGAAPLLLHHPDDRVRGALGFYRGRTAEEVNGPDALVARLKEDPRALAAVEDLPSVRDGELRPAAERAGIDLETRFRVYLREGRALILVGARPW